MNRVNSLCVTLVPIRRIAVLPLGSAANTAAGLYWHAQDYGETPINFRVNRSEKSKIDIPRWRFDMPSTAKRSADTVTPWKPNTAQSHAQESCAHAEGCTHRTAAQNRAQSRDRSIQKDSVEGKYRRIVRPYGKNRVRTLFAKAEPGTELPDARVQPRHSCVHSVWCHRMHC